MSFSVNLGRNPPGWNLEIGRNLDTGQSLPNGHQAAQAFPDNPVFCLFSIFHFGCPMNSPCVSNGVPICCALSCVSFPVLNTGSLFIYLYTSFPIVLPAFWVIVTHKFQMSPLENSIIAKWSFASYLHLMLPLLFSGCLLLHCVLCQVPLLHLCVSYVALS